MTSLTNQIALISGGTGGLGRAVSLALLIAGATVAVTYRKADEFSELQSAAGQSSSRLEGHQTDVADDPSVNQLIKKIIPKPSRLDILINTVGGFTGGQKFWDTDTKSFD